MSKLNLVLAAVLLPVMVFCNTWIVDQDGHGDFTSINAAVNSGSVSNGDIIVLEPDTYNESVIMDNTRRLTIASRHYLDPQVTGYIENTKVIGPANGTTFLCEDTSKLYIHGITVTGSCLYGVYITDDAQVSVEYCHFVDLITNDAYAIRYLTHDNSYGDTYLQVSNSLFDNIETGVSMYFFEGYDNPDIGYNEFNNCYIGISMIDINAHVHHNEIHNCHYGISSADGHSNTSMEYNLMYDNTYGMRLYNAGSYLIDNCTFYGNTTGLRIYYYNSADVNSCIFYNNTTPAYCSQGAVNMLELFYCLIDTDEIDYDYRDRYISVWDFYEDPDFVNPGSDDYRLYDTSPCIDRGDISRDDPDNSRRDVGHYIVEQDEFLFTGFGTPTSWIWKWLCFPRLPVSSSYNTGQAVDSGYIREHWNSIPSHTTWYHEEADPSNLIDGVYEDEDHLWDWDPESVEYIYSTYGYKIKRKGSASNLYSPGKLCEEDTDISIVAGENWIGYFLEESQAPSDAFPSDVLDDLTQVQTQTWTWTKSGGVWPEDIYTLNYGDCVVVQTTDAHTFEWETPRRCDPVYRPVPEHYTYLEEIDYLPIYLDFGENELPLEAAVYVDDVCRGAVIVDGQITQLCAYVLECDPGLQVEFEFFYNNRMESKRIQNYGIDLEEGTVNNTNLETGMPDKAYWISFRDISFEVPEPPLSMTCFPNPFNPELTISFSMDETDEVEIVIYNSKGQKVRTLADELFRPADYNLVWNGMDDKGQSVSSGVYFIRLITGNEVVSSKVVLLK